MIAATISEILAQKGGQLWSIAPEATVFEAIQLMAEKNIGAVLVMQSADMLGVVSERDYTRKVALKGKSSKETRVVAKTQRLKAVDRDLLHPFREIRLQVLWKNRLRPRELGAAALAVIAPLRRPTRDARTVLRES